MPPRPAANKPTKPPAENTPVTKPPAPKEDSPTLQDQKINLLIALFEENGGIQDVNWSKVDARLTDGGKNPKTETVKARYKMWFPSLDQEKAPQKSKAAAEVEDEVMFHDVDLGKADGDHKAVDSSFCVVHYSIGGNVLLSESTREEEPEWESAGKKD